MTKGLMLVNSILVGAGLICSALLYSKLGVIPLMVTLAIACVFNIITGVTNTPSNINSKFRKWLFGEGDEVDIHAIAKKYEEFQKRR